MLFVSMAWTIFYIVRFVLNIVNRIEKTVIVLNKRNLGRGEPIWSQHIAEQFMQLILAGRSRI